MREEKAIRTCQTSFVRAAQSSLHVLAKRTLSIDLKGLTSVAEFDTKEFKAARHLLEKQPDLIWLPAKLDFYCEGANMDRTGSVLHVKKSGTLCATPDWAEASETVLQTVRATFDCNNRPWYDTIRVQSDNGSSWYAELRLMFEYCGEMLAFVRWYDVVEPDEGDILSQYGCVCLELQNHYDVIPLQSIICREYIVPDFRTRKEESSKVTFGRYHVSAFKWDRLSVGFKEELVDQYGNKLP